MPQIHFFCFAATANLETRSLAEVLCDTYNWRLCFAVSLLKFFKEFCESQRAVVDDPTRAVERNNLNQGLGLQVMHLHSHSVFGSASQILSLNSVSFNVSEFVLGA